MSEEIAEIKTVESSALVAITKGEMATQIDIAKRYPRSLKRFKEDAITIACNDLETAESCWYEVPRDGKTITGPSVRLAEICGSAWGNIRFGSRLLDVTDSFVTAQGFAHDLQTNVAVSVEVDVPILKKDGRRYSESMIITAGRAAQAIAKRNAILNVIPKALVNQILAEARKVAAGSIKSLDVSRVAIADYFKKLGIDAKRVAAVVGKAAIDDLTTDDIVSLRAVANGIKSGETSLEDAFPRAEIKMPQPVAAETPKAPEPATEAPKRGRKKKEEPEPDHAIDQPAIPVVSDQPYHPPEEMDEAGPIPPANGKLFADGNPAH